MDGTCTGQGAPTYFTLGDQEGLTEEVTSQQRSKEVRDSHVDFWRRNNP